MKIDLKLHNSLQPGQITQMWTLMDWDFIRLKCGVFFFLLHSLHWKVKVHSKFCYTNISITWNLDYDLYALTHKNELTRRTGRYLTNWQYQQQEDVIQSRKKEKQNSTYLTNDRNFSYFQASCVCWQRTSINLPSNCYLSAYIPSDV